MTDWAKRRVLGLLRIEIDNIRKRGFGGSFRETVLCIHAGTSPPRDCCEGCPLLEFVPPEHRNDLSPCLHIPLGEEGETAQALAAHGDKGYLEKRLLAWLEHTAQKLEKELSEKKDREEPI